MRPVTFDWLLEQLLQPLVGEASRFREPLRPDLRLAVGLYALFHNISIRNVGALFGVGTATAHESRDVVVSAINDILYNRVVRLPRGGVALQKILDGFAARGMVNCFGAIDGCHVRITNRGLEYYRDFWNYKHFLSILIQVLTLPRSSVALGANYSSSRVSPRDVELRGCLNAMTSSPPLLRTQMVCDTDLRFLSGVYGWPGKANDGRVWRSCHLHELLEAGVYFLDSHTIYIGTVRIDLYLISDGGYGAQARGHAPHALSNVALPSCAYQRCVA